MNNDKKVDELAKFLSTTPLRKIDLYYDGDRKIIADFIINEGYSKSPQTLPNVKWPERKEDITGDGLTKQQIGWNKYHNALMKDVGEAPEGIRSMEEFQRKYFPNLVGKECPYCSSKIGAVGEAQSKLCWKCKIFPCECKEAQPSGLVPLNRKRLDEIKCQVTNKSDERFAILLFIQRIMSEFGTPAIPSVDSISDWLYDISHNEHGDAKSKYDLSLIEDRELIATAINSRLKGDGNEKT